MRTPTSRCRNAAALGVAMTPMIDVVFLLLVFFLCTASFQRPESELAASLVVESPPTAGAGGRPLDEAPLDDVSVVGTRRGGETVWTVNDGRATAQLTELAALLGEVAAVTTELPVTIDAAAGVTLAEVVRVYDAAREAGFVSVRIAADVEAVPSGRTS